MKRLFTLLAMFSLLFALPACGQSGQNNSTAGMQENHMDTSNISSYTSNGEASDIK